MRILLHFHWELSRIEYAWQHNLVADWKARQIGQHWWAEYPSMELGYFKKNCTGMSNKITFASSHVRWVWLNRYMYLSNTKGKEEEKYQQVKNIDLHLLFWCSHQWHGSYFLSEFVFHLHVPMVWYNLVNAAPWKAYPWSALAAKSRYNRRNLLACFIPYLVVHGILMTLMLLL